MTHPRPEGLLIALEGIDCSGKSTHVDLLRGFIEAQGRVCHVTAEPSSGPVGRLLRQMLVGETTLADADATMALLFAADRLDHLAREIQPRLDAGEVVLCDRYVLSSLAYQSTHLPLVWVSALNERARPPDGCILLRLSAEVAAQRRRNRGGQAEHFDTIDRQRQVARAYDRLVADTDFACRSVDVDRSVDEVAAEIRTFVGELMNGCGRAARAGPSGGGP